MPRQRKRKGKGKRGEASKGEGKGKAKSKSKGGGLLAARYKMAARDPIPSFTIPTSANKLKQQKSTKMPRASFSTLPPELVCIILLELCRLWHAEDISRHGFALQTVSHISRLWRAVALATPQLWSHIILRNTSHPGAVSRVRAYLSRSRSKPLHIEGVDGAHSSDGIRVCGRLILQSLPRVRSFEVWRMQPQDACALFVAVFWPSTPTVASSLRSLILSPAGTPQREDGQRVAKCTHPSRFPKLNHLAMPLFAARDWGSLMRCQTLTSLIVEQPEYKFPVVWEVLAGLAECKGLQRLSIRERRKAEKISISPYQGPEFRIVKLPALRALELQDLPTFFAMVFMAYLACPSGTVVHMHSEGSWPLTTFLTTISGSVQQRLAVVRSAALTIEYALLHDDTEFDVTDYMGTIALECFATPSLTAARPVLTISHQRIYTVKPTRALSIPTNLLPFSLLTHASIVLRTTRGAPHVPSVSADDWNSLLKEAPQLLALAVQLPADLADRTMAVEELCAWLATDPRGPSAAAGADNGASLGRVVLPLLARLAIDVPASHEDEDAVGRVTAALSECLSHRVSHGAHPLDELLVPSTAWLPYLALPKQVVRRIGVCGEDEFSVHRSFDLE